MCNSTKQFEPWLGTQRAVGCGETVWQGGQDANIFLIDGGGVDLVEQGMERNFQSISGGLTEATHGNNVA